MKKIKVYDPPMCCSSGVCGASVDEKLVEFSGVLRTLAASGVVVERFNMSQEPRAFVENAEVMKTLEAKGQKALPLIFVDDELRWSGAIPPAEVILKTFKINVKPQAAGNNSCCGGKGCC